jgi:hypothetical protein
MVDLCVLLLASARTGSQLVESTFDPRKQQANLSKWRNKGDEEEVAEEVADDRGDVGEIKAEAKELPTNGVDAGHKASSN